MLLLILLCGIIQVIYCKPKLGQVIKEDLLHISCDVCENGTNELYRAVQGARSLQPKGKLDEVDIVVLIESLCDPKSLTGEWIRKIDIVESLIKEKKFLSLVEPGGMMKCGNECATIASSCSKLFQEEIDADDLSALLWKNKITADELKKTVCQSWTKRCRPRRKALANSYERVDEEFVPQSDKDIEMERMMENMRAMGMGGSLYNKEELGEMMGMDDEDDIPGDGFEL